MEIFDNSGNNITQTGSQIKNPYGFTGRRFDKETGLWYYRNRMYSASLGRFMQRDPAGYVDGMNLYAYVKNNPLRYLDPWGLELRVYNRPVSGGILKIIGGNHAFLYSTKTGQAWGTSGSLGSGGQVYESETIKSGAYNVVPNPNNISAQEVMDYMRDTRNSGLYIPGLRDCHSAIDRTLDHFGLDNPGAPGGRLGTIPLRPKTNSARPGQGGKQH